MPKKETGCRGKGEKEKEAALATKAVNAHVLVPSMARITEIPDNDDSIRVSLYAVARPKWLVDSGATHHISLVRSDFVQYTPTLGVVSLGGCAEIRQIRIGTIVI